MKSPVAALVLERQKQAADLRWESAVTPRHSVWDVLPSVLTDEPNIAPQCHCTPNEGIEKATPTKKSAPSKRFATRIDRDCGAGACLVKAFDRSVPVTSEP